MDPCSYAFGTPVSIVELGLVRKLDVVGMVAHVELSLTMPACSMFTDIASQVRAALVGIDGIEEVTVHWDFEFEWTEAMMSAELQTAMNERRARYRQTYQLSPRGTAYKGVES